MKIDRTYLAPELQHNRLKDRRLRFLRAHQDAFDVEPNSIISLFEEAVLGIEDGCGIEPFCNVEKERLFAAHFLVSGNTWPGSLTDAVKFLDRVETGVYVKLNRDLFYRFAALHIDSHKIIDNTIGIDLKPRPEDSCIKLYVHIKLEEEPEELVRTALALDGGSYSSELLQVLLKSTIGIVFNIFLNGYSDVELWAGCLGDKEKPSSNLLNRGRYLKDYVRRLFSPKVNSLLGESRLLAVAFSKAKKAEPLLSFHYKYIKDIRKYFSFNSLGDRIYSFCESQDYIVGPNVIATELELEKDRLEKFTLSYHAFDEECII